VGVFLRAGVEVIVVGLDAGDLRLAEIGAEARDLLAGVLIMTSVAFYRSDRPQSGGRYGNCLH
jgi:hypothetical protein